MNKRSVLFRYCLSLFSAKAAVFVQAVFILLFSCSPEAPVREYFESHEMTYPADVSGIDMLSMMYVGIKRDELASEEAREFIGEGVMYAKEYFMREDAGSFMPGILGVVVNRPVLFRGESGNAGLMVTVTGFGTGTSDSRTNLEVERMGKDKLIWRAVNFAYFNRNEFYKWQFGGWVY